MNEIKMSKKYEIVAKYIKDISFEIPSPDCFVSAAENLELIQPNWILLVNHLKII